MPLESHLARDARATPTLVMTTETMPPDRREALAARGVEVLICPATPEGHVDLSYMLRALGARGVISVLCEGGPTMAASLLAGEHIGRIYWLIAPEILGSASLAPAIATSTGAPKSTRLRINSTEMLGADLLVTATLSHVPANGDDTKP
jgi:diaminohydroxyphosphoribosylaminopyrimidine deaminase/5-amino-6-(5-phosphoribosylamino)uracil reductase